MQPTQFSPSSDQPFVSGGDASGLPSHRNNKKILLIAIIAAVIVVAGVVTAVLMKRPADNNDVNAVSISSSVADVSVNANGLVPKSVTVKKGQEVTWTNTDGTPHHLTADQTILSGFDTSEPLDQGDTYTYIFDKAGTYHYYDAADPAHLTGTVTVQ